MVNIPLFTVFYIHPNDGCFFPQLRRQKEALYRKKQRERLVEWLGELRFVDSLFACNFFGRFFKMFERMEEEEEGVYILYR